MGGAHDEEAAAGTPGLVPAVVVKGKRSKRQRVHALPVVLTAATAEWSSSAASATAAAPHGEEDSSGTSPSSDEAASTGGCVTVTTEEEEDMALCLVLLSRGEPAKGAVVNKEASRVRSRRPAAGVDGAGEVVYECKTCNRCFPSFQALGGHRTSHKKPRLLLPPEAASEDNNNGNYPATALVDTTTPPPPPPHASFVPPPPPEGNTADETVLLAIPLAVAPAVPSKQEQPPVAATASAAGSSSSTKHPRVHECSICGTEFASGQALGGHMRRHRPLVPAAARDDITASSHAPARIKVKSLLELDLNMPAPCDEAVTSPRFAPFAAERQPVAAPPMLFPAALVDCHY